MNGARAIGADLIAVPVAVTAGTPRVLIIEGGRALPSGPFAAGHRSLQAGLRAWVEEQTHHPLGYVEQLYTFADRDRGAAEERAISISYLGLTGEMRSADGAEAGWRDWYGFFLGLDDAVLIKDDHIAAVGGIRPAIARARAAVGHLVKIEVDGLTHSAPVLDIGLDQRA